MKDNFIILTMCHQSDLYIYFWSAYTVRFNIYAELKSRIRQPPTAAMVCGETQENKLIKLGKP
ncbi:hypothetical protein HA50_17040 [Pantoea cypripedii]|uniref:Uncharacterized protein n=1 Tax=Pantoea cypripedii TaxID=55209 RepID=A0A1X1EYG5_PANCY|nr:hypothetical protein [Pantoea cypripedii]ORM94957.1 hypothetical protein HA50_17040 [Pantoea cypripedii]